MKYTTLHKGFSSVVLIVIALAVALAGGAAYVATTSEEGGDVEEAIVDNEGGVTPATNERGIDPAPEASDEEEDIEPDPVPAVTPKPDSTEEEKSQREAVSSPDTVSMSVGDTIRVDGKLDVTLTSLLQFLRPSGSEAKLKVSIDGGCGANADPECLGPPSFNAEVVLLESDGEGNQPDPVEAAGYLFNATNWSLESVGIEIERAE